MVTDLSVIKRWRSAPAGHPIRATPASAPSALLRYIFGQLAVHPLNFECK